jgi:hypothetical protein
MTYILVIWTLVGYAGTQYSTHEKYDWRPVGDFYSLASCDAAGVQLSPERKFFRCLKK